MERIMDVELFLRNPRLMGRRQPTLHGNTTRDVPACSCQRVERGRMDCLLRLLAEFASAEPRGRHTHQSAGGARNIQGRTTGAISGGLQIA